MKDSSGQQQQVCREKIAEMNPLLRLTFPYAAESISNQLLAIHSLYACLDQLVVQATDDYVSQTQLEWWRVETLPANMSRSRHPVVGYLHETGAAELIPAGAMSALLDSITSRLETKAPLDLDQFNHLCQDLYQPRIEIETALTGGNSIPSMTQGLLARPGGYLLLLRDSFRSTPVAKNRFWWVPLNLLARSGLARDELLDALDSVAVSRLFTDVHSEVQPLNSKRILQGAFDNADSHLHLILLGCLHNRQLVRLQQSKPSTWAGEFERYYIGDVFSFWKAARSIRATSAS